MVDDLLCEELTEERGSHVNLSYKEVVFCKLEDHVDRLVLEDNFFQCDNVLMGDFPV